MLWFFLNLLLLAAIFLILFNFRFAAQSAVFRGTAYRIETVTRLISDEVNDKSRAERDEILKKYGEAHGVEFFMFDYTGKQLGGREIVLPAVVFAEISAPENQPFPLKQSNAATAEQPARRPPPRMSYYY